MQRAHRTDHAFARVKRLSRLAQTPGVFPTLLIVVIATLALAGCAPFWGQAKTSRTPNIPVSSPQSTAYVPTQRGYALNSIYMVSASDGWAVGSAQGAQDPLIVHYTGGHWEQISNPSGTRVLASASWLTQVVMLSASEGWAVGGFTDFNNHNFGLMLHYTGGLWTRQTFPNVYLSGLTMLSPREGWAVGTTSLTPGPSQKGVLLHYTGGSWASVPAFGSTLTQVVMLSPGNGWIVGQTFPPGSTEASGPSLWRFDGNAWTAVTIPGIDTVTKLSLLSASDGWAVGFKAAPVGAAISRSPASSMGGDTVFAYYDGQHWTAMQTMQNTAVAALSLDASNDGWAVGTAVNPPASGGAAASQNLYLHNTGGKWMPVDGPADDGGLQAVFMLSASDGWAVEGNGAILRYQQGGWQVVVSPVA
ncbi:MAG TPA: hypothetical protein VFU32_09965 [Ktedonobacterales bacterium]|nr:hypothetical protein [Ktedonobacterales bacterium]